MTEEIYQTAAEALDATNEFYSLQEGFQYSEEKATEWVRSNVKLPKTGRVLDLCCGDGLWSEAIRNVNPTLKLYGVDISSGAIEKARKSMGTSKRRFVVADAENDLPFEDGFFHLIFARGPGLYNQHSMDRPASIKVIEYWHEKLDARGLFYSIFSSKPELMGTYTPIDKVKLPYNRSPRKTDAVDFTGGKYHHTIQSFLTPFWKAQNVEIARYSFINNLHVLVTRRCNEK